MAFLENITFNHELHELEIYNTTSVLTNRFTDVSNLYFLPLISIYGVITNFVSILVAAKLDKDNIMNLFMLYNSILNFFFCFFCIFLAIVRCGVYCSYGYTYYSRLYELYVYLYVCYSILLATQLLQGVIAINRLLAFSKNSKKYLNESARIYKWLAPLLIAFSFVFYAANVLSNRYVKKFGLLVVNNSTYQILYKVAQRDLPDAVKDSLFVLNLTQNLALQIVLFVVDMFILGKFIYFMKQKGNKIALTRSKKISYRFENSIKILHNIFISSCRFE